MKRKRLYNLVSREELKRRMEASEEERTTLSFYRYHHIDQPRLFRNTLFTGLQDLGVCGRIYVAKEGINGQISLPSNNLSALRGYFKTSFPWMAGMRFNIAIDDDGKSFYKLKIKVRDKIVADGLDDGAFDVTKRGKHLNAREVNALMDDPNTMVVDMRNHYESEVGYFEGAICPNVDTFREALPIVEEMLEDHKHKPMIMYCTGGIRCEKASAYYLHKGFEQVYMIDGGIIEYARQCNNEGLPVRFKGKNFVFDERLGERITPEVVSTCHQCGRPCDTHKDCANDACHILFIQCDACAEKYNDCCSSKCADFIELPEDEQKQLRGTMEFNGSAEGKGRLKAVKSNNLR